MKKLLAVAAATASAFLLAGCAATGTPTAAAGPSTVTVSAKVTVTDVSRTTRTVTQTQSHTVTATPTPSQPITPAGMGGGVTTSVQYSPPDGYDVFGTGASATSYRFLDNAEFDCSESDDSCWGVSIHTQSGCSRGGSATLTIYVKDGGDTPVGEVSGQWASSAPNEAVAVTIGQVGLRPNPDAALTADLTSIKCSS